MSEYSDCIPEISLKMNSSSFKRAKIKSSKDCYDYLLQFYGDDIDIYESFFLLLLNNAMETIGYVKISQGGCAGTVVDIKIVAKYCIDSLAQMVILCHNHPSGSTIPSKDDIRLTEKIKNVLVLFECPVIDHLIITKDNFYSFADEGIL